MKAKAFFKKEPVLCVAAACALLSMVAIPPSAAYAGYIDLRVLGMLWSLMTVVAGFRSSGIFEVLTHRLLTGKGSGHILSVLLVLLPFFAAMAVTNDVALITFVPFTLLLLQRADCSRAAVPIVVLQTLAANLGCMATPVGSPHNLYLYAYYNLSPADFFSTLLPLAALSLVCLTAAAWPILPKRMPTPQMERPGAVQPRMLTVCLALFFFCLLTVFRVLPWWALVGIVLVTMLVTNWKILKKPDYALLLTFVCFFVFSGNLGEIQEARLFLQSFLEHSTLLASVLVSQVISNVPAAMLLSSFTHDWRGLLLGVNIGGLGSPVASLASLISLNIYLQSKDAKPGRYLVVFTAACLIGMAVLLAAVKILQ